MDLATDRTQLLGKKVRIYLIAPEGFKLDGLVIEVSEGFIVLQNTTYHSNNYVSKNNVSNIEQVSL